MSMRTTTGGSSPWLADGLRDLKARLRGHLLQPGDDGYEAARQVWNAMIDRRPAAIARCEGVGDVLDALAFARAHGLLVAVRGGGHNVAGNAVVDGGLVIDLSPMKSVRVDPVRQIARAEPGLTWGEFDRETQALGLAVTGGIQSTTGIAGFTLGGGFGYLARKRGLTCDNLLSADVVTADGRLLTASAHEHPDLFWGIRGGGGNFGIVTSFELQLAPLGPILGGMLLYPLARAGAVLRFYREYAKTAPDELFTIADFTIAPAAAHIPERLRGQRVLMLIVCYAGELEEGARVLQPLRAFGPPDADLLKARSYREMQQLLDAANPAGRLNYWKSEFVTGYSDAAIETLVAFSARAPSPYSKTLCAQMQGAIARVDGHASAYSHRQAPFLININAMWTDPAESEAQIAWARDFWAAMQPFSAGGVYVNFLSNEGEERVKAAYGEVAYARLAAVKRAYDPDNVFRVNQNIAPASTP
ncbi:MAG TPA: FAD-binding oxidoreductase [Ktedonobacterales bacterium]